MYWNCMVAYPDCSGYMGRMDRGILLGWDVYMLLVLDMDVFLVVVADIGKVGAETVDF